MEVEQELEELKKQVRFKNKINSEQKEFLVMLFLPITEEYQQNSSIKNQYNEQDLEKLLSDLKAKVVQELKDKIKTKPKQIDQEIDNLWKLLQSNPETEILTPKNNIISHWQCGYILHNQNAVVNAIAISPDGKTLVSASSKEIKLWNLSTKELIENLSGCSPIVFSPDGTILISGGDGNNLKVWYKIVGNKQEKQINDFVESGKWWEVLRISKNATEKEVKEAYRNLARQYHPDLNADEQTIAKMQIINKAYEEFFQMRASS